MKSITFPDYNEHYQETGTDWSQPPRHFLVLKSAKTKMNENWPSPVSVRFGTFIGKSLKLSLWPVVNNMSFFVWFGMNTGRSFIPISSLQQERRIAFFSVKSFRVFLSDVWQVSPSELVVLETDGRKTLLYFHFVCLLYFDFARSSERVKWKV